MVSSIGSSSSEVGRNLLLELLAKNSKNKVSATSSTSTDETSSSTSTKELSFEDLIGLLSSSKSQSEMAPPPPPQQGGQGALPTDVDSDGDGSLSTDEYDKMISNMGINGALSSTDFFSQYDVNNDGEISADEMPEPGSVAPNMTSSTSETSDLASKLFSQYDTNQDGTISASEFSDMITSLQGETTTNEDSNDSNLLLQRIAMDAIKAYEENYGYSASTTATSSLNNIA